MLALKETASRRQERLARFATWRDEAMVISPKHSASNTQHIEKPSSDNKKIVKIANLFPGPSSTDAVVGTCTSLEKDYLRLTSAVDPSTVRPPSVLREALKRIQQKWVKESDYAWCCNQLKAIRQDCTVQRLKNTLVVRVYETHARISLEEGDLEEFAQCQTQLQDLYKEGLQGARWEFCAYKILHLCVISLVFKPKRPASASSDASVKADFDSKDSDPAGQIESMASRKAAAGGVGFQTFMQEMYRDPNARPGLDDPNIKFALAVRAALVAGNYASFFKLYRQAPNMTGYLLDFVLSTVRDLALEKIRRSYTNKLSLRTISVLLGFLSTTECAEYLRERNIVTRDSEDGGNEKEVVLRKDRPAQPIAARFAAAPLAKANARGTIRKIPSSQPASQPPEPRPVVQITSTEYRSQQRPKLRKKKKRKGMLVRK
eukprot:g33999.t1